MKKLYLENFEYSNFVFLDNNFYIEKEIEGNKEDVLYKVASTKSHYLKDIKNIKCIDNNTTYLEEFISGKTLDQIDIKKLSFLEVKLIIKDILKAMNDLHELDVIHRDIKPENIVITKNNNAILIDYNIARVFNDNKNKDTTLYGTEYYASPEQYGSLQTSFSSDIYSFGKTIKEVFQEHSEYKKIEKIIDKCLEFDPNNRYDSVVKILNILDDKKNSSNKIFKLVGLLLLFISIITEMQTSILYAKTYNVNNIILYSDMVAILLLGIFCLLLLFRLNIFNKEVSFLKNIFNGFIYLFIIAALMVSLESVFSLIISI